MTPPESPRTSDASLLRPAAEAAPRVALPWVVKLRYGLLGGELLTIAAVLGIGVRLPWELVIPLAVTAFSNYLLGNVRAENPATLQRLLGGVFCLDTLCLTAALSLCGGPVNPFSLLYLVQITVSAVVLDKKWTWVLGGLSTLCFGLLFWVHRPLPALEGHHTTGLSMHLTGMWIAFAVAATLTAFFIGKLSEALRAREQEVLLLEKEVAKSERLASLVTLAAGAAHELGTPLASIAVAAKELERYANQVNPDASVSDDARLIRSEVERCRQILQQMSARGAEPRGEAPVPVSLQELIERASASFTPAQRSLIEAVAEDRSWLLPPEATAQALAALLKNALDASTAGKPVRIAAKAVSAGVQFRVADHGCGMSPDVLRRVAEPFFTTKDPGKGMGLGTFLVRLFAERMGGSLRFQSDEGNGTLVLLEIPSQEVKEKVHGTIAS
jgi:two-component system sensor histidine kinase RegB